MAKLLLERGATTDCANHQRETALTFSAAQGFDRIVKLLVVAGADPNHRTKEGWTAKALAEKHGHENVLSIFRKRDRSDSGISSSEKMMRVA